MAEWSNAPVLKTGVLNGTGGSNPSLSATFKVERNTNLSVPFSFSIKRYSNSFEVYSCNKRKTRYKIPFYFEGCKGPRGERLGIDAVNSSQSIIANSSLLFSSHSIAADTTSRGL